MNEALNILVVDDEEAIRQLFATYLADNHAYHVFTAANGEEALGILNRGEVHCCFTDLAMPRMDGIELAKAIHAFDNTIPVVVMTGEPRMEHVIQTLKSGVMDFLVKPFRMNQVPLIIERVMRERSRLVENFLLKEDQEKYHKMVEINKKLQQKTSDLENINLILQKINEAESSAGLFHTLVNVMGQITSCDQAALGVLSKDTGDNRVIASYRRKAHASSLEENSWMDSEMVKNVAREGIPCLSRGGNGEGGVITVPLKVRSTVFGVLSARRNGGGNHCFTEKDLYFMNLLAEKASSSIENIALYENIYENLFATLSSLAGAIEARDPYTRQHSFRVQQYALIIAPELGLNHEQINILEVAGALHDIGKIGIPDHILLKPGKLTEEEYDIIKKHPGIGGEIISHFHFWEQERDVITHHHERWDGKGYPDHLKGEEIPMLARILAIADVYDALTTDRSYRRKIPEETAIRMITENAGTQFDAKVVDAFLSVHEKDKLRLL